MHVILSISYKFTCLTLHSRKILCYCMLVCFHIYKLFKPNQLRRSWWAQFSKGRECDSVRSTDRACQYVSMSVQGTARDISWPPPSPEAMEQLGLQPWRIIFAPPLDLGFWETIFLNIFLFTFSLLFKCRSLIKRITPKIGMLCFVLINSIILNLLCGFGSRFLGPRV